MRSCRSAQERLEQRDVSSFGGFLPEDRGRVQ